LSILTQFIMRISFGLALGMAITPPRQVTSGYYRNHLYVLLGFNVLATLVAWAAPSQFPLWPPLSAAVLSYVGSVLWLYEKPRAGIACLACISAVTLVGAWLTLGGPSTASPAATLLHYADAPTSGLVLGGTIAAMFLGHWYLNTPTMALGPLRRLIVLMAVGIALRAVVCGAGLVLEIQSSGWPSQGQALFLGLRWLSGLLGAMLLSVMAWKTLQIPNTQSATGILYVGVIVTFLGELVSLLLSNGLAYPV
jgi:hypothetical protein